jgi:hypothetical protein
MVGKYFCAFVNGESWVLVVASSDMWELCLTVSEGACVTELYHGSLERAVVGGPSVSVEMT